MKKKANKRIYLKNDTFTDKVIVKYRLKMASIITDYLKNEELFDVLDIGTTEDSSYESSNALIKNLKFFKKFKSISDQKVETSFFFKALNKSIVDNFTDLELKEYQSDVVISNATIEHVGSLENQIKMCENIIKLSKKYFIILTPNRYHPIEFHSKLPLIHWLPKKIHRYILSLLGMTFLSDEKNLNLLSSNDLDFILKKLNQKNYEIKSINFLFFKSNLLLFGKKS